MYISFVDQAFDDGGARGRSAETFGAHRVAQLLVLDQLAGTFHRGQQGGFRVACRRLGLQRGDRDLRDAWRFLGGDRHQRGRVVGLGFLAVDFEPAGVDHDFAVAAERFVFHARDAGGDLEFRGREKNRQKPLGYQVVNLRFGFAQVLGRDGGRNDRKVVRNLGIVENAFVRFHPFVGENFFDERLVRFVEFLHRSRDGGQIVFGQRARIGTRIGQYLVFFVQRLRNRQGGFGRKSETRIAVALQAGQIVQQRRELGRRLAFLFDNAALALAFRVNRVGARAVPQAFGLDVAVVGLLVLAEFFVEPAAIVLAGLGSERRVDFKVVTRNEFFDLLLALDQDSERRSLHSPDGRQVKAARFGIESRHCARGVDADQPVGFRAADRRVGQRQHILVAAQVLEALADRRRRHRLQPQALNRLGGLGMVNDVTENQFAFAPGVARVEQPRNILEFDQPGKHLETLFRSFDRQQIEVLRNDRQIGQRPFTALDLDAFRRNDRQQVADCGRQQIFVALEIIAVFGETTQYACDVVRDRRFFGNDEFFAGRRRRRFFFGDGFFCGSWFFSGHQGL